MKRRGKRGNLWRARTILFIALTALCACGRSRPDIVTPKLPAPEFDPIVACSTPAMRASVLFGGAVGVEGGSEPHERALRAVLDHPPVQIDGSLAPAGWRQLYKTADKVVFGNGDPPGVMTLAFERHGETWRFDRADDCIPYVVPEGSAAVADWFVDPSQPLGAMTTTFTAFVSERACHGWESEADRILDPEIHYGKDVVTVAFYVRPLALGPGQGATCPGTLPVSKTVTLEEQLGGRKLLNGGVYPAAEPTPGPGDILPPPGGRPFPTASPPPPAPWSSGAESPES